jgi:hypothetical protein
MRFRHSVMPFDGVGITIAFGLPPRKPVLATPFRRI